MDTACAPHAKPHITTEARKADSRPHQRPTSAILKVWASALHNQLVWNPAFLRGNRRQNTKDTLPWNQLEKQVFGNVLSLHLVLSESLAVSTPEHAYLCFKRYLFCPEGHSPALESASGNTTSHTHTHAFHSDLYTVQISSWIFSIFVATYMGFPWWLSWYRICLNEGDLGWIPGLGRSPGEEKDYPLQYSSLENSMDYVVHGITKSWTRLSNFHFHFM